jgi:hypothetical protein
MAYSSVAAREPLRLNNANTLDLPEIHEFILKISVTRLATLE